METIESWHKRYSNIYVIPEVVWTKMHKWAEHEVMKYEGHYPEYGHNKVKQTVIGVAGEYGTKQLYAYGDIQANQTLKGFEADLLLPKSKRQEEVKTWQSGYSFDKYFGTVTPKHAKQYHDKQRDRVWFCEVNYETRTVTVHGWLTPAEILECRIIETDGRYGGKNHLCEVMHRVEDVMGWIETDDTRLGRWW